MNSGKFTFLNSNTCKTTWFNCSMVATILISWPQVTKCVCVCVLLCLVTRGAFWWINSQSRDCFNFVDCPTFWIAKKEKKTKENRSLVSSIAVGPVGGYVILISCWASLNDYDSITRYTSFFSPLPSNNWRSCYARKKDDPRERTKKLEEETKLFQPKK